MTRRNSLPSCGILNYLAQRWAVAAGLLIAGTCSLASPDAVRAGETRYAFIAVASDYPHCTQLSPLEGTSRDAEQLQQALLRGGFAKQNIVLLYDRATDSERHPLRANILRQLDKLLTRTKADDLVLVVTVSHGVAFEDGSYLCPADTTDEAISNAAAAARSLIPINTVTAKLSACAASKKLMLVDACRDMSKARQRGFVNSMQTPPDGVWLMSSCSEGQSSLVSRRLRDGEPHALFSYFLCEGLSGMADLVGSNDGRISLCELCSYAYRKVMDAAEREGHVQTPELFVGVATPFIVADTRGLLPPRLLTSSDPDTERRATSSLAGDYGNQLARTHHEWFRPQLLKLYEQPKLAASIYREYYNRLCCVMGTYLTPALQLDANNKIAHLARGDIYRVCGMYADALEEFEAGNEHFELYVKGQYESISRYYEVQRQGLGLIADDENAQPLNVRSVKLFAEPSGTSRVVADALAHSKIRVTCASDTEEWLLVTAVNDRALRTAGWIHRQEVHWLPEAADIYTPDSPLSTRGARGGRLPTIVARLDYVSSRISAVADRVGAPARKIGAVADRIDNSRAARVMAIAGRFGVPNYLRYASDYIRVGQAYASIPEVYVRRAGAYVELTAGVARVAAGWAQLAGAYEHGLRQADFDESTRRQLIEAKTLEPIRERRIIVTASPWQAEPTSSALAER